MEDIAEELDSEGEEEEEGLSVDATNGKVSFTKGGSAEEDRGRAGEASGGAETLSSPTPPSSPPPPPLPHPLAAPGADGQRRSLSLEKPSPGPTSTAEEELHHTRLTERGEREGDSPIVDTAAGHDEAGVSAATGLQKRESDILALSGAHGWAKARFTPADSRCAVYAEPLADPSEDDDDEDDEFDLLADEDSRQRLALEEEEEKIRRDLQRLIISQNLRTTIEDGAEDADEEETERDGEEIVDVTGMVPVRPTSEEVREMELDVAPDFKVTASGAEKSAGDGETGRERQPDIPPDFKVTASGAEKATRDCEIERERKPDVLPDFKVTASGAEKATGDSEIEREREPDFKDTASGAEKTPRDSETEREGDPDITPDSSVKAPGAVPTKADDESKRETDTDVAQDLKVKGSCVLQQTTTGDGAGERENEEAAPERAKNGSELQTGKATSGEETETGDEEPEMERTRAVTADAIARCPQRSADLRSEGEEKANVVEPLSEGGRKRDTGDSRDPQKMEGGVAGRAEMCADRVVRINGCRPPDDDDCRNPIRRLCRASDARRR